ncbi:MAG: hypothetical protein KDJ82_15350 [Rhodobacteraceae bacterium]|jgi:hypothetical protein|nr:hypothetical protein [Paracoccaceae bacterium]
MPNARQPLFLARQSYRRRRMMDAARLLPVLGSVLFMMPVLWRPAETPLADTGPGAVYLFAIWALLIGSAVVLARALAPAMEDEDEGGGPSAEEG